MPTTTNHGGGDDEDCPSPPRRSGSGIGGGVKSDFKKMVASVFSRIQGTDAFRKMKLRHNTDANIKLVKDLKHAVYIKPEHKLGHSENHGHHLPHHSSESESDVASIRSSEGGHKKVHFEDLVEEIRCARLTLHPRPKKKPCIHYLISLGQARGLCAQRANAEGDPNPKTLFCQIPQPGTRALCSASICGRRSKS